MIKITKDIILHPSELEFRFIRASGPGGQNVNKVATAVQLRFNVLFSSLPLEVKVRLSQKITRSGDLIIKANRYRTQEHNKQDALERLITLLRKAAIIPKKRKKTKPTLASKQKRLNKKKRHSLVKQLRRKKLTHEG